MMKKKTRAVVAGSAGAAVLLASGATFALWSDSDGIEATPISTGELALELGDFDWFDQSVLVADEAGVLVPNPALPDGIGIPLGDGSEFLMVPGDIVAGTVNVAEGTIVDGTNLVARLVLPGDVVVSSETDNGPIDHLDLDVDLNAEGTGVVVTLDWSAAIDAQTGNGMNQTISLNTGAQVLLEQVRGAGDGPGVSTVVPG